MLGPLDFLLLIRLSPDFLLSVDLLSPRLNLLLCSISSLLLGRDCLLARSLLLGLLLLTRGFHLLSFSSLTGSLPLSLLLSWLAHSFSLRLLRAATYSSLLL